MTFIEVLTKLQPIYRVKGVVHIGVGGPHSLQLYEWLNIKNAVFIDANQQRLNSLNKKLLEKPHWFSFCEVIGYKDTVQDFYLANNTNQSSLIPPEELHFLWKNLRTKSKTSRQVSNLKTCLKKYEQKLFIDDLNLLNIDCFPTLEILKGATELLQKFDIVIIRAVKNEALSAKLEAISHKSIDEYLTEKGFINFEEVAENHPVIMKTVYVKDLSKKINALTKEAEKKQRKIEKLTAEISEIDIEDKIVIFANSEVKKDKPKLDNTIKLKENNHIFYDFEIVNSAVEGCITGEDILEETDKIILGEDLISLEKFFFCIDLSKYFSKKKDFLTSQHFVSEAKRYISDKMSEAIIQNRIISKQLLLLNKIEDSFDHFIDCCYGFGGFSVSEKEKLSMHYKKLRGIEVRKDEHGHQLLLDYLTQKKRSKNLSKDNCKPIMIEIGTTREDVAGQGSTLKLGKFCAENGIAFVTVDMDPHNSRMAKKNLSQCSEDFEVVTMKGEEFLKNYKGKVEYVFLDAYDFDHGKHSKLRQSRYQKYLGSDIIEKDCHLMHLECAKSLNNLMSEEGVICIDDTWCDEKGEWAAKGKLAVPYLLDNGFEQLSIGNNAVLLQRKLRGSHE